MQPCSPTDGAPAAPTHADSSSMADQRDPPPDGDAAAVSVAQRELGNAADTTTDLDEPPPVQSQDVPASESPSPAGDTVEAAAAAASSDQHHAAAVVRYPEALSSGASAADAQLLAAPDDGVAPRELQLHQPLPNGSAPHSASAAAKASDAAATQRQLPERNAAAAMAAVAAGTAQEGLEEATEPGAGRASAEQRSEQGSTRGTPTAGEAQDDDSTTARSRGGSSAASAAASPTAASATLATAGVGASFCSHPSLLIVHAFTAKRGCYSAARAEAISGTCVAAAQLSASTGAAAEEPATLGEARAAWRAAVEALAARELHLERKGAEVADVQALCRQLQARARRCRLVLHSSVTRCRSARGHAVSFFTAAPCDHHKARLWVRQHPPPGWPIIRAARQVSWSGCLSSTWPRRRGTSSWR